MEFGVEISERRGGRVPRRVLQRLLSERPTPEKCVEAYYLQRTRFESIAERKLWRQLTEDGNVEISGRSGRPTAGRSVSNRPLADIRPGMMFAVCGGFPFSHLSKNIDLGQCPFYRGGDPDRRWFGTFRIFDQQRPLGANQLPASGVVNYQGTITATDFSVPIQFAVDFGAGSVQATFTIPPLTVSGGATNGFGVAPSGDIDAEGSFLLVSPNGVFVAQPGVSVAAFLAGNFFNAQARNIAGVFLTQFCLNATNVPCPGVVTRSGSYEATRVP